MKLSMLKIALICDSFQNIIYSTFTIKKIILQLTFIDVLTMDKLSFNFFSN